eukprot:994511-Rhodomonas_salina.1
MLPPFPLPSSSHSAVGLSLTRTLTPRATRDGNAGGLVRVGVVPGAQTSCARHHQASPGLLTSCCAVRATAAVCERTCLCEMT